MYFDGVPAIGEDDPMFPGYDEALASAANEARSRFIGGVLGGHDPSLRNLLTSSVPRVDAHPSGS